MPRTPDPQQEDRDGDGVGDACSRHFESLPYDRTVRDLLFDAARGQVWVATQEGGALVYDAASQQLAARWTTCGTWRWRRTARCGSARRTGVSTCSTPRPGAGPR